MLSHLKIWQKALFPVLVLAVTALGLTFYLRSVASTSIEKFETITDHRAPGTLALARLETTLAHLSRVTNRAFIEKSVESARETEKDYANLEAEIRKYAQQAEDYFQIASNKQMVQKARDTLLSARAAGRDAMLALEKGDAAGAAKIYHEQYQPRSAEGRKILAENIERLAKEMTEVIRDAEQVAQSEMNTATTIGMIVVLLGVLVALFVNTSGIIRPIKGLTTTMLTLARGDLSVVVPYQSNQDEIGEMSKAVQVFKDQGIQNREMQAEAERKRHAEAERDRRDMEAEKQRLAEAAEAERREAEAEKKRIEERAEAERRELAAKSEADRRERDRVQAEAQARDARAKALAKLIEEFERKATEAVKALSTSSADLNASAQSMVGAADNASQQAASVAAASEQATANVQTVASAAEELSSSISEISRQVAHATRVSNDAKAEADRTSVLMNNLSEASQKIGDVVGLITTIAGQTNLLALNATIEAARAGEAGKGFAVVASEVKNLANQTAKATGEIGEQITAIQDATAKAVGAIKAIVGVIDEVSSISTSISAAVEEQGSATGEIARNVQEAATGTQMVSSKIGEVSAAADTTGSGAKQVENAADMLAKISNTLKSDIEVFLRGVRQV